MIERTTLLYFSKIHFHVLFFVFGYNAVFGQIVPDSNGIVYVKTDGAGNGSSWEQACNDLQVAIFVTGVQEVWVAGGTYKPIYHYNSNFTNNPTAESTNRMNAFVLKNDVKVYGGFAGTESSISERNLMNTAYTSILSGDLDGDNVLNAGNAYHVVRSEDNDASACLNGFTIEAGNSNSNNVNINGGGGIYNKNSSPTLSNLIISHNNGVYGGGICNSGSAPTITNVIVRGNTGENGGGIYSSNGNPVLINVVITGNSGNNGGGIYHYNSSSILTNITISGNAVRNYGGGIYNSYSSNPVLRNSIVYGNQGGVYNNGSSMTISYSIVQSSGGSPAARIAAWNSAIGTDGGNNLDVNPLFTVAPTYNNAPFTNGDYSLLNSSPAIDKGDNTANSTLTDLAGDVRVQNGIIDMGGLESGGALPVTLINYSAKLQDKGVLLQWETAAEAYNDGFVINRSQSGFSFESIATLDGNGTTNDMSRYRFFDPAPLPGINYYQLIQKDVDGTTKNLGMRAIYFEGETLQLYPNPASLEVRLDLVPGQYQQWELLDLNGRSIGRSSISSQQSTIAIPIQGYISGNYLLKLTGMGQVLVKKLTKI